MIEISEELKRQTDDFAPLIIFFGWPANQQLENLPILEKETKYDFPDGDVVTNNALEVLLASYVTYHNSIHIKFIILLDESTDKDIQDLESLFSLLLSTSFEIAETSFDDNIENINILQSPEWEKLRQLSREVQRKLNIQSTVNSKILEDFTDARIHP
jgi:hypothetical protein